MKKNLVVTIIGTFVGGVLLHHYINLPKSISEMPSKDDPRAFVSNVSNEVNETVKTEQRPKLFLSEALPQIWEGTFYQDNYGEYPMVLNVENIYGDSIIGKINWPSFNNSVVSMEGKFVNEFSNFTELVNWKKLPSFDKNIKQSWLFFTSNQLLSGSGVSTKGRYYVDVSVKETMKGIFYPKNGSLPVGKFNLRRTE